MSERSDGGSAADLFPTHILGRPEVRDLPAPPVNTAKIIGPGIVAAGVGLASGEFILYPYIASQVGLVFVWAALVGVLTQFFLNMEIERYTLATGETALTGFSRFWRHWGLVFALMTYFANLWPGWATSSATMVTYLVGGEPRWIAIGMLIVIGAEHWASLPQIVTEARIPVSELGFALLLGALAFAGAGGGQNLCQSNWIRDKGFGMGKYVPRIKSPVTGEPEAAPSTGFVFEPDAANLDRWQRWWRFANVEQLSTFVLITFVTITFTSLLAYATVYGQEGLKNSIDFVRVEGEILQERVGAWFGVLFWFIGAFSLFAAATGIVDYTSRLAADVLRTSYLKGHNESRLYFVLVWGLVAIGILVLLVGVAQPLVLLVISACVGGLMMFIYSALLIILNRRLLSPQIRPGPFRIAMLAWAFLLFGILSILTLAQQVPKLWAAG